VTMLFVRNIL